MDEDIPKIIYISKTRVKVVREDGSEDEQERYEYLGDTFDDVETAVKQTLRLDDPIYECKLVGVIEGSVKYINH